MANVLLLSVVLVVVLVSMLGIALACAEIGEKLKVSARYNFQEGREMYTG